MAAARRLRSIERAVEEYHGLVGLSLTRAVLVDNKSIEKAAREYGADTARGFLWWGTLFRKCLDVLTRALGLSNSARPPRHPRLNGNGGPDLSDPGMHADAGDLGNVQLRRGRPNGANGHGSGSGG